MTVHVNSKGVIDLAGRCGAEDAEVLQQHLLARPGSPVEWLNCEQLHAAVLQVLLVAAPRMTGAPGNEFLKKHIAPILGRAAKED